MGTEEQSTNGGGVATASDTLSVTDNRTGKTYEIPIEDGTIRALALRDIKVDEDDFGLMTYDPAYMNTASCRSAVTYLDGDNGVLEYRGYPIEQLAEQSTYLEVAYLLIHGELPDPGGARRVDAPGDDPHLRAREHQDVHAGLPLRRAPDGHARRVGRRPLDLLSGRREQIKDAERPLRADRPARGEDADAGGVLLPPQHGPAVRLSGQRPALPRQLPLDDVQDDRAQVRAGSPARAGARHPLHPPRRPRAELLDLGGPRGRLLAGRPLLAPSPPASPRSTARCTAAPTRRSCGCCAGSRRRRTSPTSSPA